MEEQKIKWKYVGTEIYFFTSPEDLEKQKEKNRRLAGVTAETETEEQIITNDDRSDNNNSGCRSCNSNAETQSTISVGTEEDETAEDQASRLSDVLSILDDVANNKNSDWGFVS